MSDGIYLKLPEMLRKEVDLYVKSGYFENRSELIREAIREFLEKLKHSGMNVAIELYRKGDISLGRAAEISGVGYERMKEILVERGIPIRRGPRDIDELNKEYKLARELL